MKQLRECGIGALQTLRTSTGSIVHVSVFRSLIHVVLVALVCSILMIPCFCPFSKLDFLPFTCNDCNNANFDDVSTTYRNSTVQLTLK